MDEHIQASESRGCARKVSGYQKITTEARSNPYFQDGIRSLDDPEGGLSNVIPHRFLWPRVDGFLSHSTARRHCHSLPLRASVVNDL